MGGAQLIKTTKATAPETGPPSLPEAVWPRRMHWGRVGRSGPPSAAPSRPLFLLLIRTPRESRRGGPCGVGLRLGARAFGCTLVCATGKIPSPPHSIVSGMRDLVVFVHS